MYPEVKLEGKSTSVCIQSSCRVLFLGAAKVGKTSIIKRFIFQTFDPKYTPTIDEVYTAKFIVRNYLAKVDIMDTSGSFDFPAMLRLCISKADAFVIVFSHDNPESLNVARRFLEQIRQEHKEVPRFYPESQSPVGLQPPFMDQNALHNVRPIVAVCNKADLPSCASKVSENAIMEWLLQCNLKPSQFVYASAKSNEYILNIFKSLWSQNEASKTIVFEKWTDTRRSSMYGDESELSSKTSSYPCLRILASDSGNLEQVKDIDPIYKRCQDNLRPSFFRSSFKINRRSSSKLRKTKSEYIRLDCAIS